MIMNEHLEIPKKKKAVIKVCGVGGGGGNAVNRMIDAGLSDVQFIAINTDAQDLEFSKAETLLQIGSDGGLGAGSMPDVGRDACEQSRDRVRDVLTGADMVFLALGLGGGTGTGAAPIVAQEAKELEALTVAIVTLPFSFEGEERMNNALTGLEELEKYVDSLIVVPNDRIAELSDRSTSFLEAFRHGDEVLYNGVRAISELITVPGIINIDFADVRTIMKERGRALMGIGIAEGEDRALHAAREAVVCPLLEQSNINGARGVLVNVRGGRDMLMHEVDMANTYIKENASSDATIISGAVVDADERPEFQVTVIATGFPKVDAATYRERIRSGRMAAQDAPCNKEAPDMLVLNSSAPHNGTTKNPQVPVEASAEADELADLFSMSTGQGGESSFIETKVEEPEDLAIPTYLREKMEERRRMKQMKNR